MKPEEYMLTAEEASAVVTCVRIAKKLLENGNYEFENADLFHNLVISSLYKLTDGKEGFRIVTPTTTN